MNDHVLWNKETPTEEGWYFWCERKVKDPFYWHTYYVAHTDLDPAVTFFFFNETNTR